MRTEIDLTPGPQPGGRDPAPGDLGLVQAFVNSNYDLEHEHGAELFATPTDLRLWLTRRGLIEGPVRVTAKDLRKALTVREGLRALLVANHAGARDETATGALDALAPRLPVTVSLGGGHGKPRFAAPRRDPDGALGLILALVAAAMLEGTWKRMKACRECRWAFYDHSRNGAGSWCSMAVCGGRVKQRAHYRRERSTAGR